MKLHFILHESFEAPAAFEIWANNRGFEMSYTRLNKGDTYPDSIDNFDFLVVMGGPQSPSTTIEECSYFDAKKEIAFIKKVHENEKYLIGVCLGAQLIGEALGANYSHSPNREIGVYDIALTEEGKKNPIFSTFPEKFAVGHWHGDMPGLTKDTKILATSEGCPRQIVMYDSKTYGFQCHFEFNEEAINGMIENSEEELEKFKGQKYIQNAEQLRANDYEEMNKLLFNFLDYLITVK